MKPMTLENWLYRRDREEHVLLFPNIDYARHLCKHAEAEQEIEEILRT